MTNNSPDDLPNDDFKISEDKLREFLESSQQDIDYEKLSNSAWGANIEDREIIDFIERVGRIKQSMGEKSGDDIHKEIAELINVVKGTTSELKAHTLDPALIERLADVVSYQCDAIVSITKQLSRLRVIVYSLIGILAFQSLVFGMAVAAIL